MCFTKFVHESVLIDSWFNVGVFKHQSWYHYRNRRHLAWSNTDGIIKLIIMKIIIISPLHHRLTHRRHLMYFNDKDCWILTDDISIWCLKLIDNKTIPLNKNIFVFTGCCRVCYQNMSYTCKKINSKLWYEIKKNGDDQRSQSLYLHMIKSRKERKIRMILTLCIKSRFTQVNNISLVFCVCFVDRCLFFCTFSDWHYVVCSSTHG
jgi:hypothetical protein